MAKRNGMYFAIWSEDEKQAIDDLCDRLEMTPPNLIRHAVRILQTIVHGRKKLVDVPIAGKPLSKCGPVE